MGYNARLDALREALRRGEGPTAHLTGKWAGRTLAAAAGVDLAPLLAGPARDAGTLPEPDRAACVVKADQGATENGVWVLEREGAVWRDVRRGGTWRWADLMAHLQRTALPSHPIAAPFRRRRGIAGPFWVEGKVGTGRGVPVDVKVVCLGGAAQFVLLVDRTNGRRLMNTNLLGVPMVVQVGFPQADLPVPSDLDVMVEAAERVAATVPGPFVRVDLYAGPVFGELTVCPGPAFPVVDAWDALLGHAWAEACASPS